MRQGARKPVATTAMIVVLALGLGFNAALFLLLQAFTTGPLPGVEFSESLVRIRGIDHRGPGRTIGREFSYDEYRQYQAQSDLFEAVAAWTSADVVLGTGDGDLRSGAATYVTANYFEVLGIQPAIGTSGTGEPPVAIITHVLWTSGFGADPNVVGRTMTVNGMAFSIAGVAPRRFNGARTGGSQMRVWLPLEARDQLHPDRSSDDDAVFGLVARLRPGIVASDAQAVVRTIGERVAQQGGPSPFVAPSADVVTVLADNYFPPSGETPGVAGRAVSLLIPTVVLLITCTNVGTLLAVLAVARRREVAVRLALGAARLRIVRQFVTESVLLAFAAGATALFVLWALSRTFEASLPDIEVVLDWRVLLFTALLAVAAGIGFGVFPALHATHLAAAEALKAANSAGSVRRPRLQTVLVVAQIAVTQPALLAMGALINEMVGDLRNLPGSAVAASILEIRFNTNPRYGLMDDTREEVLRRLQTRIGALPGVTAVVAQEAADHNFELIVPASDVSAGTAANQRLSVRAQAAPAGYFALMGIPVVRGREFVAADETDGSAIVIEASAARRLWGSADPVGRRVTRIDRNASRVADFVVVGVVDNATAGGATRGSLERIYLPDVGVTGHFLVRTQGPAQPHAVGILALATAEAPQVPVASARTLAAIEEAQRTSIARFIAAASGVGTLALFISAMGLYAVIAFAVGQRTREIGIRTALGADRTRLVAVFLRQGLRLSAVGLTIGLAISLAVLRGMSAVTGNNATVGFALPVTVAAVVTAVALVATWIPARRAASLNPLEALRTE